MAEVIGVVGSTLSIIDAIIKFKRYAEDVIRYPSEREDFLRRLECVKTVHRAVEGCKAAAPITNQPPWLTELDEKSSSSPLYRLQETMTKMAEVLMIVKTEKSPIGDKFLEARRNKWKWHSDKKNLEAFFAQIQDHCINILVVLHWSEADILSTIGKKADDAAVNIARIEAILLEDRASRVVYDQKISEISEDIKGGRQENLDVAQVTRDTADELKRTAARVELIDTRTRDEVERTRQDRDKIQQKEVEKWLSPLEFARRHQLIHDRAALYEGSSIGKWFFAREEFRLWREGHVRLLRGYGEPGAGKTILSSAVVEEMKRTSPKAPVLCVYFEQAERLLQTAKNIRGSLLKQLVQLKRSGLTASIRDAFVKASYTNTQPNDKEVTQLLKAEIESHERVYVVVDGLDEASNDARHLIENNLKRLSPSKVSILTMSRKDSLTQPQEMTCDGCEKSCIQYMLCRECPVGPDALSGLCFSCHDQGKKCVEDSTHTFKPYIPKQCEVYVETPDEDIAVFLQMEIASGFPEIDEDEPIRLSDPREGVQELNWQCYHKPELFSQVVDYIVKNAEGRFLLAREYVKHFRNKIALRDIRDALLKGPKDGTNKLFPFYAEDMRRIMEENTTESADLARNIFALVYFAKRNLRLVELQQALAIRAGDVKYEAEGEIDEDVILRVTNGLIAIDQNTSMDNDNESDKSVRFDHLTRTEYFDEFWQDWFPDGKLLLAKTCLQFMSFEDFAKPYQNEQDFVAKEREMPFISYAVQFWGDHVREAGPEAPEITKAAIEYLRDPTRVGAYIQAAWTAKTQHKDKWDVRRSIHPLHICAWFDLCHLIPSLNLNADEFDVQEETHGQTPLMYACRRGSVNTVEYLLRLGALPNKKSRKGRTALFEAILRLKPTPKQNSDADTDKSEQIVELLLDSRLAGDILNPNIRNPRHVEQTALITSIEWQQTHIARLILKHPKLKPNLQDLDGISALHLAATNGLADVVIDLLRLPTINISLTEAGEKRTALHLGATYSCRVGVVEELLRNGADPNLKDSRGATAILRSVEKSKVEAFQALIISQAPEVDLTCIDEEGRSLMHFAAATGTIDIVKMVQERVPKSINLRDFYGITPLHEACMIGNLDVVQFLLENGASCDVLDHAHRNPLVVAEQYGYTDIAKHIGDTTPDGKLRRDLPIWSLANLRKLEEIKQKVSDQTVDLKELEPRTERNALHCAVLNSKKETGEVDIQVAVLNELLATNKIPVDDVDKHQQTPLHFAAINGNLEITKVLLRYDQDLDLADAFGMTALRIAFKKGYHEIAISLIAAGATIDKQTLDLEELLFAALKQQNLEAVIYVIQAGADRTAQDEDGRIPDMVARDSPKILGVLKSTKSYRWRPSTLSEKEEVDGELMEDTIRDVKRELRDVARIETVDEKDIASYGNNARKVHFTPFASREVDLTMEKEAVVRTEEIEADSLLERGVDEVRDILGKVSFRECSPLPAPLEYEQPSALLAS